MADGATVSNLRQENGHDVVDVTTVDGGQHTLHVDSETRLPAKVMSAGYNGNLGDVTLETEFGTYEETGGLGFQARLTLPRQITQRIDRFVTAEYIVSSAAVDAEIGDLAAPEEVRGVEAPMPSADVTVEEVTAGVWHLTGQSHHSVLVEFPEYLVLIEAPQNDTRTLAVIEQARELQPEKPLRYVINTHHHFDHSGGMRAAVSEGLTVITHELNRPFFEDIVARQHTIVQDALATNPQPLAIETVPGDDRYVLEAGRQSLEIYPILNSPHADTLLMVYLPRERLLVEADVFSPGAREAPFAANLLENIEQGSLRVDRVVPIHGSVVPFSELEEVVMAGRPSQ
jgi:glyoxylase-like metal-dependent hydrolase (beta-lactamase superfamily II)